MKQLSTAIRELEPFHKYFYFLNSIPNFCLPAALSEPNIRVSEHFIISAVPSYSSNPMKKEGGLTWVSQMASWDTEAYGGCLYPVTEVHERRAAVTLGLPCECWHSATAGRVSDGSHPKPLTERLRVVQTRAPRARYWPGSRTWAVGEGKIGKASVWSEYSSS